MNAREEIRKQILDICISIKDDRLEYTSPEQAADKIMDLVERNTDMSGTKDVCTKEYLKQMHFKQMCGLKL